jgi:hypothetical protein
VFLPTFSVVNNNIVGLSEDVLPFWQFLSSQEIEFYPTLSLKEACLYQKEVETK